MNRHGDHTSFPARLSGWHRYRLIGTIGQPEHRDNNGEGEEQHGSQTDCDERPEREARRKTGLTRIGRERQSRKLVTAM